MGGWEAKMNATYERSYATARSVFSFLELIGWATVGIGALIALVGFATGGLIASFTGQVSGGARLVAMLPGLGTVMVGLIGVANVQIGRANVDNAEMTREMLHIARRYASSSAGPDVTTFRSPAAQSETTPQSALTESEEPKEIAPNPATDKIKNAQAVYDYKGTKIYKRKNLYFIDGDELEYKELWIVKNVLDARLRNQR